MSLTEISVRVAIVTACALIALLVIGWRRPAQEYPRSGRRSGATQHARGGTVDGSAPDTATPARRTDAILHGAVPRKFFDIIGLGSIATLAAIVFSLGISLAIARMVTALLNRL